MLLVNVALLSEFCLQNKFGYQQVRNYVRISNFAFGMRFDRSVPDFFAKIRFTLDVFLKLQTRSVIFCSLKSGSSWATTNTGYPFGWFTNCV